MKKDPLVYLQDISDSIDLIEEYLHECSREKFNQDFQLQDAIHRRLEIIGEAANRLPVEFTSRHPEIPWPKIVGLRNRLAHEYDFINLEIVWDVVANVLPKFHTQIKKLLPEA